MTNSFGLARHRFAVNWKLKASLSIALTLFFCIPYFALQHLTVVPIRRLPLSALDQKVAFEPTWVWIYQSVYLLLSVVPWLATSANDLKRYARGFALQACVGFAFFLLVPIEGPRPSAVTSDPMFRLLVSYDAPLNSFPSLHVGLSVYTVLFASRALRDAFGDRARVALISLWIWTLAIAFAALATKQHYAIDLPAGALLAWGCHFWTWRADLERNTHASIAKPWSSKLKGARMPKRSGLLGAVMFWMLSAAAAAQQPPAAANPQEGADHESLRKIRALYEQAIRESRIELLQPHLHGDFHGVMVTGRAVNGFADLQQYWRDIRNLIGEGGTYTTTLNPERSVIVGEIALARGTTDDVVKTDDGAEFRFTTLWTATLQREGGNWKIRSVQGTMDPVGNPFVREFGRRAIIRTASWALLAGVVVGITFGLIWQRRRARRAT